MPDDTWAQRKELFREALDLDLPAREAFIRDAGLDDDARDELLRLLAHHASASEFLQTPMNEPTTTSMPTPTADPMIGRRLGGFRILRRLGTGGMGVVYEARQERPDRRAAIKLLRPGWTSSDGLRRLGYEAELLARLQHPGIAHVYAAGSFDLGEGAQPWFAMELIDGEPLDLHVDATRPGLRRIIELLVQVCDAVQHAHQRGVVHRDLKPANVLVTPAGQPKVLDFGVARAIDTEAGTMHTRAGDLMGTLSYMSPEQLAGDPEQVDTRSDVYALGVIGYELLSGVRPHERGSRSVVDVIRSIETETPPKLGSVAPACRGDVETIIARALEKDRERRYPGVAELSADLERYLRNEPILARPNTVLYQARMFARRNRALVGGMLATMLALAVGLAFYVRAAADARVEAARSRYEADKATAINTFITNDFLMKLLAAANTTDAEERLPVIELVDQAADRVETILPNAPLHEAAVRNELGTIYYNLGRFERGVEQYTRALALWTEGLGPDHADTLKAVNNLGQSLANLQRLDEAETHYRRAVEGRRRVLGPRDPATLSSMNNLANLLMWKNELPEAETLMRQTLDAQLAVHGEDHKHVLITRINLGSVLLKKDQPDEARRLHELAHATAARTLGPDHVTTRLAASRLASTFRAIGDLDAAGTLQRDTVAALTATLGPDHPDTLTAMRVLARIHRDQGDTGRARAILTTALDHARTRSDGARIVGQIERDLGRLPGEDGDG